ncbi:hypothetical protein BIW11_08319 [Tropilaelaps mercedesae]|uniref:Uncharacterized protein n=1 Tax=Tropilaelaps mercedesae TaxID=418985 RepID=A0A1V9XQ13_9ACAR|nr:hypothetical protein BIW11_08319 [Tropilaelaps mercedesae]
MMSQACSRTFRPRRGRHGHTAVWLFFLLLLHLLANCIFRSHSFFVVHRTTSRFIISAITRLFACYFVAFKPSDFDERGTTTKRSDRFVQIAAAVTVNATANYSVHHYDGKGFGKASIDHHIRNPSLVSDETPQSIISGIIISGLLSKLFAR